MFKKAFGSALILVILVILYFCYYSFYILPKDVKTYENHLKKIKNTSTQHVPEATQQLRHHVQKDIWHTHDEQRLHYRILAKNSILTLTPSGKNYELQESLEDIEGILQEKLYEDPQHHPLQQLSVFHTKHGVYDFSTHTFSSDQVLLNFYKLPDHEIPSTFTSSPCLKGKAASVRLTLSSEGSAFHADKFTAHMDLHELKP